MTPALMIAAVKGHDFELELADNSSAHALADLVGNEGLQVDMEDYGGFKKVGPVLGSGNITVTLHPK